jgi:hypothetical protein
MGVVPFQKDFDLKTLFLCSEKALAKLDHKNSKYHKRSETVSKLGLLSVFVRVSSCDFVDRLLRQTKNDPRNYTN